ncbi:MAG: GGDEF domain-containing protein [Rubrivivax sp.]|nr:GGDEF domain-containing protein [Rubrivivax sp.]
MTWRPSPLLQMSLALVALCGMLLVLADVLLGVFPNRQQQLLEQRKQVGEAVAVQVAALLKQSDTTALQFTLSEVARRTPGVRSLGLRRADGVLVLHAGDHAAAWEEERRGGASTADRIDVPMHADGRRWGSFELAFQGEPIPSWLRWLRDPLFTTMGFVFLVGSLSFSLYMRRALQHLDPSQVIPERVQGAFDAMAEGVAVLDTRGRLLLANKAFRALNGQAAEVKAGQALSSLQWLSAGLGANLLQHPWMRAMSEGVPQSGATTQVDLGGKAGETRLQHLVINAAPIQDASRRVRGCLATFSDVSQLHQSNMALRAAMFELRESQDQVKRQNEELRRLATTDPMTGCLNRRAFTESYELLFSGARSSGMALSCLVLDIDFFKKVNDTHGHSIGDRVIQEVAKLMQSNARPADLVCRYGGEEFCIVLPGLDAQQAQQVAERIRKGVESRAGPAIPEVPGMKVSISVGVATLAPQVATPLEMIDRADQALYQSKQNGRNRVTVFSASTPGVAAGAAAHA